MSNLMPRKVGAMETDGLTALTPKGGQVELSDSAANVLGLLGSDFFAGLAAHLQTLEKVGVTDMDVSVGHIVVDVHVDTLLHEINDLIALFGHEPLQAQENEI